MQHSTRVCVSVCVHGGQSHRPLQFCSRVKRLLLLVRRPRRRDDHVESAGRGCTIHSGRRTRVCPRARRKCIRDVSKSSCYTPLHRRSVVFLIIIKIIIGVDTYYYNTYRFSSTVAQSVRARTHMRSTVYIIHHGLVHARAHNLTYTSAHTH